jgi:hypothetical protein
MDAAEKPMEARGAGSPCPISGRQFTGGGVLGNDRLHTRRCRLLGRGFTMKQRTSQILYAYWNEVRGERLAPHRFEIEPARIVSILPETFILERVDCTTYRFRLAGTRICEQFGFEFRGTNFLDLWSNGDRNALERHLATITDHGAVGVFHFEASPGDRRSVSFELVLLPLIHTGSACDRLLGSLSSIESPLWLGTERLQARRMVGHQLTWPDGRHRPQVETTQRQTPFLPQIRGARFVKVDRRHFRVYDGGLADRDRDEN